MKGLRHHKICPGNVDPFTQQICVCVDVFVDVFSAWAVVDVNMEDQVDVSLKGQAEISCIYTLKQPAKMIVWFTVRKTGPFTLYIISKSKDE